MRLIKELGAEHDLIEVVLESMRTYVDVKIRGPKTICPRIERCYARLKLREPA